MKAQCVSSGKTIPVVLKATRISAVFLGIAALALAVAAVPAEAGKKRKLEKAQAEPVVNIDTKEPMIVSVPDTVRVRDADTAPPARNRSFAR